MKKNLILKTFLLAVLINSLVACAAQSEDSPTAPLRVEFTQWWGDYTLLVAQEKGFFEKYGVQVEPVYYDIFSDTYPDLAAGQIDGALIGIGDTININRSVLMRVVAVHDNGGDSAVIVGPEINSIQDLKGKKIGLPAGAQQYEMAVFEMLQSANMNIDDAAIVAINPKNALAALENNRVQAVYTREPYLSDALSIGYKTIYPNEQLRQFPNLIVFRKSITLERPVEVRAFLQAWFEAVDYRLQHEAETREIAARYLGISPEEVQLDDNLKIFTLDDNKALFDIEGENSIYALTENSSNYLISIGAIIQTVNPFELLSRSYLP